MGEGGVGVEFFVELELMIFLHYATSIIDSTIEYKYQL